MIYAELNPFFGWGGSIHILLGIQKHDQGCFRYNCAPWHDNHIRGCTYIMSFRFWVIWMDPTPIVNNCYLKLCFVAQRLQQNPTLADLLAFVTLILSYYQTQCSRGCSTITSVTNWLTDWLMVCENIFKICKSKTCNMSHVTCHVSHVMCHMSHVNKDIYIQFCGACRWRVFYQQGLPHLVLVFKPPKKRSSTVVFWLKSDNVN